MLAQVLIKLSKKTPDLTFKTPKLGNENSDVNNNPIYFPKYMNWSAVVIIFSCAGIHYKSALFKKMEHYFVI